MCSGQPKNECRQATAERAAAAAAAAAAATKAENKREEKHEGGMGELKKGK